MPGRLLNNFVDVATSKDETGAERKVATLRSNAVTDLAAEVNGRQTKLPLEPTAAFLLRKEAFSPTDGRDELVARFRDVFHLSATELTILFDEQSNFPISFDSRPLPSDFTELEMVFPHDLLPLSPQAGQAEVAAAAQQLAIRSSDTAGLVLDDQVLRRARRALANSRALAFVGPPGTGKSTLVDQLIQEARHDPDRFGLAAQPEFDRFTAESDWTARTVVGGYFPQANGRLVFQEGYLLQALRHNRWLVVDEMNRADLDRVLGPMLTFLAGQSVTLGSTELSDAGRPMVLALGDGPESGATDDNEARRIYFAGTDWRFIGTYNSVDQGRVFSMGAALTRRWATIPVPPVDTARLKEILSNITVLPEEIIQKIEALYDLHQGSLPLGPAPFIDIARYVVGEDAELSQIGVSQVELLGDAYIVYLGPQLRRLVGEVRDQFLTRLGDIVGSDLAEEIRATF